MICQVPQPLHYTREVTFEARFLLQHVKDDTLGAEVGTLYGKTAAILLHQRPKLRMYVVDDFSWDPLARELLPSVLEPFKPRWRLIPKPSKEAAKHVPHEGLDWVWIDAAKEDTEGDVLAWFDRVRPGGWIAGHDLDDPRVSAQVDRMDAVTHDFKRIPEHNAWLVRK